MVHFSVGGHPAEGPRASCLDGGSHGQPQDNPMILTKEAFFGTKKLDGRSSLSHLAGCFYAMFVQASGPVFSEVEQSLDVIPAESGLI